MAGFSLLSLSPAICLPSMRTRPGYSVKYYQRHQRGLSINDQSLFGTKALLDEVKLFDVAKEPREIFELQKDTDVEYFIDGKNFKEFGVFVSKSAGLVGRLERKEALQVNWGQFTTVL